VRYRYYIDMALLTGKDASNAKLRRIPAPELEEAVRKGLCDFLSDAKQLFAATGDVITAHLYEQTRRNAEELRYRIRAAATPAELGALIRTFLIGIVLHNGAIHLQIDRDALRQVLCLPPATLGTDDCANAGGHSKHPTAAQYNVIIATQIRTRGAVLKLVFADDRNLTPPQPDASLIKVVARAHVWWEQIRLGNATSMTEFAAAEGVTRSYLIRVLRLAFLAPDIVEAILDGRQPYGLTADALTLEMDVPVEWKQQRKGLGFELRPYSNGRL